MLQFKSASQSLPSERDRDGDILFLSQGSVNGKQVQSGGKGKEKARLTSSPLEDIGMFLTTLWLSWFGLLTPVQRIAYGWTSTSLPQRYATCIAQHLQHLKLLSKAELAVHVRKVEDVRRWLVEAFDGGPSGKLKKYRVCRLPVHQCRDLILLEDPRPDRTSWHRKNVHYSRSRS